MTIMAGSCGPAHPAERHLAAPPVTVTQYLEEPTAGSARPCFFHSPESGHFSLRDGYLRVATARAITGPGYSNHWTSTPACISMRGLCQRGKSECRMPSKNQGPTLSLKERCFRISFAANFGDAWSVKSNS